MTRQEMLISQKKIGITNEIHAVSAGFSVLAKHQRGERLTKSERVTAGIIWYEFLSDNQNSDREMLAAAENCNWSRESLNLEWKKIYQAEQEYIQARY